jgi:DNA repair exonuclease SbcCD nuclease subunit
MFTADLHLHKVGADNKRLQDGVVVLTEICQLAEKLMVKDIFHLGDFFNSREKIETETLWWILGVLEPSVASGIRHHWLVGNHDWLNENQHLHTLRLFNKFGMVYEQPYQMEAGKYHLLLMPFTSDLKFFKAVVEGFQPHPAILLMHQGVSGFEVGSDVVLQQDLKLSGLNPTQFEAIFSGHYHKHQEKGKFVYVGSPYQLNFGERGNVCGVVVADLLSYPLRFSFHKISSAPRFVRVPDETGNCVSDLEQNVPNNFVHLTDKSLLDEVKDLRPRKLILASEKKLQTQTKRLNISVSDNVGSQIEKYVEFVGVEAGNVSHFIQTGKQIVKDTEQ